MKKNSVIALAIWCLTFTPTVGCTADNSGETIDLWPSIEPFETGYLRVSDIHEIYYELCGNSKGIPVFVLHGGPGASSSPYMRRFCDPAKFLIVLHDQRGAGKSRPYAELRENTTQDLVEDIETLRKHLNLGKIILFGGSWGTTLGLAYAETYPENVSGMVLRGVFTATKEEIDHLYHGGASLCFPDVYDKLLAALPEPNRRPLPDYLFELLKSEDEAEQEKYSLAWAKYEVKMSALHISDERVESIFRESTPYSFALFENYYMAKACFLEEGQLLRETDKIKHIPTVIVNGRYDFVCPLVSAYRLHKMLPRSKLVIAEAAGHWMGEKPIEQALLNAFKEFE
ncbi:MAG: prolyl aminopeptidase [Candidatus Latescibacteria bacterium]|nr:prolyl aminopeptidase [Candidatus Latescibacterota bacterium]NIM21822.1 prolyl aminopeptidase [Candidatus Latescibacterota bacterium]NIM65960.1 prolyl aminopeptidase [Candidatus Latescibacterota bacterium]NIO02705.1 prolyl aminopeptidase [Candidatus Latescibacterota bacterium]NIO29686.1 prolyl aminopeptidase [Candidatus Latescibacterota bacterium]